MDDYKKYLKNITVQKDPKFEDFDFENTKSFFNLYIDRGKNGFLTIDRGVIENIHISEGDDFLWKFITNITIVTNQEGLEYIKSFLKDYDPPAPPEPSIIDKIEDKIHSFMSRKGFEPDYIIISESISRELNRYIHDSKFKNCITCDYGHGQRYKGIPVALLWQVEEEIIEPVSVSKHSNTSMNPFYSQSPKLYSQSPKHKKI